MSSDDAASGPPSASAATDGSVATRSGVDAATRTPTRTTVDYRRTLLGVLALSVLALGMRLIALGGRIFHWDEGRVGYWILRYHDSGYHVYRPIVHGPFLPVVNDWLFAIAPVSDFLARFPVALIGGLFPLCAWLFRERLSNVEVVALAGVLALNPLMVYYSRFMRNDVLVAAFSLFALGFIVRGFDTGKLRYAFPAAASLGLAFTTKENALVYVLCFLGAGALLADHRLLKASARGESARDVVFGQWPAAIRRRVRNHGTSASQGWVRVFGTLVGAFALFWAVFIFFYAPRPDLWQAFGDPTKLPSVLEAGSLGAVEKFLDTWAGGGHQDHAYLPYLHDLLETLVYGAPAVLGFTLVGVLVDRYGFRTGGTYRELVAFGTYWGLASLAGYPIATDIEAPWAAIHVVVPLAIPAAVGIAFIVESARDALSTDDAVSVGLAAIVVLASVGGVAVANAEYFNSASNEDRQVLQWAQPSNDLKPTMQKVEAVAQSHEGTDVLFFSRPDPNDSNREVFYVQNESEMQTPPPPGGTHWHDRLPLPWYLEKYDANVSSTSPDAPPAEALADAPPVVIVREFSRDEAEEQLDGYVAYEHDWRLRSEHVTVFIDKDALDRAGVEA
ncbi:TIGR03663 family protein [Halogeometricum borinquense]|uniref:TIGR03663 family protein n=1 Tax=Halogeometricum borinquense TaxID=60847 RepID=A0A6C0UER7_9EURY|nr:flippase activity-associated protein Agl23 [Halogeometricum borinquense]QIB73700.1 TIGR03663 family protein [Halogeometricum borinquense]QIQ76943.1 TIGR03663 family protein [Halogeometricum borinquense]